MKIDLNKDNPAKMLKTLKAIIRGESIKTKEIQDINFEILRDWEILKSAI